MTWALGAVAAVPVVAQEPVPLADRVSTMAPEVALVTFGPGEEIWSRFGHNALWIRDGDGDTGALYNFGYFDTGEDNFHWNYARGRMQYLAVAEAPRPAFEYYRRVGRGIRVQELALAPEAARGLARELRRIVTSERRRYAYDYFDNNCSTRVRDLLDGALGGAVHERFADTASGHSLRWHALRMVQDDLLLYLGIHLALGRAVDRPISRWEAMFIPGYMARQLAVRDYVTRDRVIATGKPAPRRYTPRYATLAAVGLAGLLVVGGAGGLGRGFTARLPARLWLLVSGLGGCLLLFFWLGSAHEVTARNENLLFLLPTNLLLLGGLPPRPQRYLLASTALALGVGLGLKFTPGSQFNHDLLLALAPLQAVALLVVAAPGFARHRLSAA